MVKDKVIYSDCCLAKWEKGICSKCLQPALPMAECDECMGTGMVDIIDYKRVHGYTITPPYKTVRCDKCNGVGYFDIKYDGDVDDVI